MHEPEGSSKKLQHFVADTCSSERFAEDGHALRALHLGAFAEDRKRVLRITRVPKERAEEAAVVLQDFQLGMERDAKALAKTGLPFPLFTHLFGVGALHLIVIGGNDCFLAREIIVGSAGGNFGCAGDVAHGSDFEAATAEEFKGSLQDEVSGFLACW